MADISWSAYALQMFTPEQRAAAVTAVPDPPRPITPPLPEPIPTGGVMSVAGGVRITGPGIPATGYDPNKPSDLNALYALGWRFENGSWIAPGSPGVAASPDQVLAGGGARPPGLASVQSASSIAGGSVLGNAVPAAPAVMLPTWVGGAIGHIIRSGGTRPESGGTLRVVKGEGHKYSWTRVVR